MRRFGEYNPIAVAIYFLAVICIAMFSMNPLLLLISLVGSFSLFIILSQKSAARTSLLFFALFLIMALINPLVSHKGATVLFVINDSPITAESIFYGITASAMVITVLYWFHSFTEIMTADKLLYIFGKFSPRLALILSMSLRFVPLFGKQSKKIEQTQTALGLYKDDNIIDRSRGKIRVFSIMVTWALENGIITADSMTARGYGTGKRSHFSIFKFRKHDLFLLISTVILTSATAVCLILGLFEFNFYPYISMARLSPLSVGGYISYGILCFLPTIIETEEKIKWKYLRSKI